MMATEMKSIHIFAEHFWTAVAAIRHVSVDELTANVFFIDKNEARKEVALAVTAFVRDLSRLISSRHNSSEFISLRSPIFLK